jgi:hypothetical protein
VNGELISKLGGDNRASKNSSLSGSHFPSSNGNPRIKMERK